MNDVIERYVYEVTRRLPEKEREEVSKELKTNIYDMLPEEANEDEIKEVLCGLGSPAVLAEKYRQKPRYLISPAIYDDYVRVLKWVLPLIGIFTGLIGALLGIFLKTADANINGIDEISNTVFRTIAESLGIGLAAVSQALIWITIGFVIAERTGSFSDKNKEWKIEELPDKLPNSKNRIALSDSIVELVMIIVFYVVFILVYNGVMPLAYITRDGNIIVDRLFDPGFLRICMPAITVIVVTGIYESIIKIKKRRWTLSVCGAVILDSVGSMILMLYLLARPNIFSQKFIEYIESNDWSFVETKILDGARFSDTCTAVLGTLIVIICLISCANAVYKTIKAGEVGIKRKG